MAENSGSGLGSYNTNEVLSLFFSKGRAILTSTLDAATQALSIGGKKTEKLQEKMSIFNALIKGKEAAVAAWSAGMATGGPWAPVVAAAYTAASIAKTAGLIRSIKSRGSASSGGGGSTPSPGAIQSSAASTGGVSGAGAQPSPDRKISFELVGEGFMSTDQVRQLMGQFIDQVNNGVDFPVTGG